MAWIFCSLTAAMLCIWFWHCIRAFRASFDGVCILRSWMSRPQCLQFVQKWGASRPEENLINPDNGWYGSEDRLVWFCNFFFADRTQKNKIYKWFQKWFLTPGTHSNPLITSQNQEGPDTRKYIHTYTCNQIWGPHSVPTYTPYTTGLKQCWTTSAVRFVQGFRSERSRLATVPELHTLTI